MSKTPLPLLLAISVPVLALFMPHVCRAEKGEQSWAMFSDHPAGTVAGGAVQQFAASLSSHTGGVLSGRVRARAEPASSDLIVAVQQGRAQVADVFAGSLARLDPVFELPTLPFVVDSVGEARRLACIAGPAYRSALLRAGLHLLFVSPWPPTGLWSRQPVTSADDVASLKLRTYDEVSAEVWQSLGARAAALPVQDVAPLLRKGSIDAVLSSGDGSVGNVLGEALPNFSAIRYAYPVSFVVMKDSVYAALPAALRRQVDAAALDVSQQQWDSLPGRIRANYSRMQYAGVVVTMKPNDAFETHLRDAGRARVQEWLSRVPARYADILKASQEPAMPARDGTCLANLLEARNGTRG